MQELRQNDIVNLTNGSIAKDMELSQAILQAIKEFGKNVITEPRLVNILADYGVFAETRILRIVIRDMVEQGFTRKFVDLKCQKKYVDEIINSYVHDALNIFPYREDLIHTIVKALVTATTRNNSTRGAKKQKQINTERQSNPLTDFYLSKDGKTLIKAKKRIGTTVVIPDGVEVIKENAFYDNKYITDVFIPEGVRVIESWAFGYCPKLTNVHLPKSLEAIGSSGFDGCDELKELFVPENVSKVGRCLFSGNVIVDQSNKYLKSVAGAVFSRNGRILYYVPHDIEEYDVPDGVEILTDSFYFNKNIRKVKLPKSLKIIGSSVFSQCSVLRDVVLPKGLEEIGFYSFSGCYSLEELIIPDSVQQISSDVFSCSNLNKIIFNTEYPEKIEWDRTSLSKSTYWGKLKDETVFCVPQNALGKYRILDQFKNVTLVPIADNRIQYKSKVDFCHIEDIVLGETTWDEASKKGYEVERFEGGDSRLIHCKVGTFWDFDAIGRFNSFHWWAFNEFPTELERLGMRSCLSYDAFMTLFKKWGFSIIIIKIPSVSEWQNRSVLEAKFAATSFDKSITFILDFNYGNENGEGVMTSSLNSLNSIGVEV